MCVFFYIKYSYVSSPCLVLFKSSYFFCKSLAGWAEYSCLGQPARTTGTRYMPGRAFLPLPASTPYGQQTLAKPGIPTFHQPAGTTGTRHGPGQEFLPLARRHALEAPDVGYAENSCIGQPAGTSGTACYFCLSPPICFKPLAIFFKSLGLWA